MDDRTRRIVEHTAQHQPGWAIRALGPVPADPHDREAWQYNAAVIGAYRELSGYSHPADPVGPEPVRGDPDLRAAWHDAFGRLGPVDGADVRGLPDGTLHLLRDQYQAATRWAPRYVTDALRHVRLGVGDADLQAIRRDALARAAADHGQRDSAQTNQRLAASYRAMASSYRSREMILAATDKDRREWEAITDQPRRLAIAADTELRRRCPGHTLQPLRSAEPSPVTAADLTGLDLTAGIEAERYSAWIADLTAQHAAFTQTKLAAGRTRAITIDRPGYESPGLVLSSLETPWADAILQPPKPAITPATRVIERGRQLDREADGVS